MISKELSATLGFAVRDAKKRRHEHVCLEHVLFAILHDSEGIDIIENCGGNVETLKTELETFFKERMEPIAEETEYVLQQTIGFQRVIQRAVNHARSAEKPEVVVGDILASIFQEKESHAAYFLQSQGVTRLDVLEYISHTMTKAPFEDGPGRSLKQEQGDQKKKTDPLEAFTVDLVQRAAEGKIDPLIGRELELERTLQVLCRRRKNNPVFVGDPGVGKTAMAEGLATRIHEGRVPDLLKNVRIYSLDLGGMLAGTKFRGDFEQRLKGVLTALRSHRGQRKEFPILFARPENQHLLVLRLRSPRAARLWLARVCGPTQS
jgi:ATP-dependent Clp protease ATP-binding subunit ClpA